MLVGDVVCRSTSVMDVDCNTGVQTATQLRYCNIAEQYRKRPHLLCRLFERHPHKGTAKSLGVHLHARSPHVVISPYSHVLGLWKFRIKYLHFDIFEKILFKME